MEYYKLNKMFYMGKNIEEEYSLRYNSYSTYHTNLNIKPINRGIFEKGNFRLFLLNSHSLMNLYTKVIENSKTIKSLSDILPKVAHRAFVYKLLINELQSTNEIESVSSTKKELAEVFAGKNDKSNKRKRFIGLAKMYSKTDEIYNLEQAKDIRRIYDELVDSEVDEQSKLEGELFREESVNIDSAGKIVHRGVASENIVEMLEELLKFMEYNDMPYLYKIMIFHYFFEYIHPFYDGNGRVGRYLLYKQLLGELDELSSLTFSYSVNRNKNKYYKSFIETSHPLNRGELTFFVEDMISILKEGQESVVEFLEENIKKLDNAHKKLEQEYKNDLERSIFFILLQDYLFSPSDGRITLTDIAKLLGASRITVVKYIENNIEKVDRIKSKPTIYKLKDEYVDTLIMK